MCAHTYIAEYSLVLVWVVQSLHSGVALVALEASVALVPPIDMSHDGGY